VTDPEECEICGGVLDDEPCPACRSSVGEAGEERDYETSFEAF